MVLNYYIILPNKNTTRRNKIMLKSECLHRDIRESRWSIVFMDAKSTVMIISSFGVGVHMHMHRIWKQEILMSSPINWKVWNAGASYTPEHNAYPYNYMIGSEAQRRDAVDYLKLSLEMAKMGANLYLQVLQTADNLLHMIGCGQIEKYSRVGRL